MFVQLICAFGIVNEAGLRVGAKSPTSVINLLCTTYTLGVFFPGKINLLVLIGGFAAKCQVYLQKNMSSIFSRIILYVESKMDPLSFRVRWTFWSCFMSYFMLTS